MCGTASVPQCDKVLPEALIATTLSGTPRSRIHKPRLTPVLLHFPPKMDRPRRGGCAARPERKIAPAVGLLLVLELLLELVQPVIETVQSLGQLLDMLSMLAISGRHHR